MRPHESTRHFPPSPITKLASGLVAASLGYAIEERGEKVVSLEKAAQVSFVKQQQKRASFVRGLPNTDCDPSERRP